jgi:hypothetical protein
LPLRRRRSARRHCYDREENGMNGR